MVKEEISAYGEITASLEGLAHWQRAAFTVGCAERIAPLVRRLGSPDDVGMYESGLEVAWRSVAVQSTGQEVLRLQEKIKEIMDSSDVDEGDSPEFYVMQAMSVLDYALRVTEADDIKPPKWACSVLLSVQSGFDLVLRSDSRQPVVIDLNNPPSPGPLQAAEIAAQKKSLRIIEDAREPDESLLSSLRHLSRESSRDFDEAIPEFARRMGWTL